MSVIFERSALLSHLLLRALAQIMRPPFERIGSLSGKQAACAAGEKIVTLEIYAVESSRLEDNQSSEFNTENDVKLARMCDGKQLGTQSNNSEI